MITTKYVSYLGKELKEFLNDLAYSKEYGEEKESELELVIDGFGRYALDMAWRAPVVMIPNKFINPFLNMKIKNIDFFKYDDGSSKIYIVLDY